MSSKLCKRRLVLQSFLDEVVHRIGIAVAEFEDAATSVQVDRAGFGGKPAAEPSRLASTGQFPMTAWPWLTAHAAQIP